MRGNRKYLAWLLLGVCVASFIMVCTTAFAVEMEQLDAKADELESSIKKLASQIMLYNKPVFEVQLTQKERQVTYSDASVRVSRMIYDRVWAKDDTIVVGCVDKSKKLETLYFATKDPNFVFAGGIRVGADTKVIEKFLGTSMSKADEIYADSMGGWREFSGDWSGSFGWDADGDRCNIILTLNDQKTVEQITYSVQGDEKEWFPPASKKALPFIKDKIKNMKLRDYLWYGVN